MEYLFGTNSIEFILPSLSPLLQRLFIPQHARISDSFKVLHERIGDSFKVLHERIGDSFKVWHARASDIFKVQQSRVGDIFKVQQGRVKSYHLDYTFTYIFHTYICK